VKHRDVATKNAGMFSVSEQGALSQRASVAERVSNLPWQMPGDPMEQEEIKVDAATSALLLIDIQPDFMPGGALPVREGDRLVAPVSALVLSGRFELVLASQDWHPPDHVSFASNHPDRRPFEIVDLYGHPQTLWPDHCVQGTPGAGIHSGLPLNRLSAIIRKGTNPGCDSYSAFRNNWNATGGRPGTGLAGFLRERGTQSIFLCGLARDFCVKWSAEDGAEAGFRTRILWDLTRPVDPSSDDRVLRDLVSCGVKIISSNDLES
jgi:nicotinamidase/pyrazinamidase